MQARFERELGTYFPLGSLENLCIHAPRVRLAGCTELFKVFQELTLATQFANHSSDFHLASL